MAVMFFEGFTTARTLKPCAAIGAKAGGTGGATVGDDITLHPPLQTEDPDDGQNYNQTEENKH